MGWTAFLRKLGKILSIAELGFLSIIVNGLFDFYIGIKAYLEGKVSFTVYEDSADVQEKLALFTNMPISFTVGVFAMAFMVHNASVPMLRKNRNQGNNSRDLKIAYSITGIMYFLTGTIGTMGLYWRPNIRDANVKKWVFFSWRMDFKRKIGFFDIETYDLI